MKKKFSFYWGIVFVFFFCVSLVNARTTGSFYFGEPTLVSGISNNSISKYSVYDNKIVYIMEKEHVGSVLEASIDGKIAFSKEINEISEDGFDVVAFKDTILLMNKSYDSSLDTYLYNHSYIYDYTGKLINDYDMELSASVEQFGSRAFIFEANNISRISDDMFIIYPEEFKKVYDDGVEVHYYTDYYVFKYNSKIKKFQVLYPEKDSIQYNYSSDLGVTSNTYVSDILESLSDEGYYLIDGAAANKNEWALLTYGNIDGEDVYTIKVYEQGELKEQVNLKDSKLFEDSYYSSLALLDDFYVLTLVDGGLQYIPRKMDLNKDHIANGVYLLNSKNVSKVEGTGNTFYALNVNNRLFTSTRYNYTITSNVDLLKYDKYELFEAIPGNSLDVSLEDPTYTLIKLLVNEKEKDFSKMCKKESTGTICVLEFAAEDENYDFVFEKEPYKLLGGENQVYNKKSDLVFRSEGPINLFKNVTVNGKELVKDKDYTIKEGSTIVTLKNEYLNGLANGAYELSINFTDAASTKTTFKVDRTISNPNTRDSIKKIIILLLVTSIILAIIKVYKRNKLINNY